MTTALPLTTHPATIVPHPHQTRAIAAALAAHRRGANPVLSAPTGSGKSVIAAGIAAELDAEGDERFIITVPSRELAEQNEAALRGFLPADEIGVVCASLGRREWDRRIIVGTPQSLAGKIRFDPAAIIVDEAHQMPLYAGSWFDRLFEGLPQRRATPRIGLSATAFRTADGALYGRPDSWFDCQPFEISVAELVDLGFLAQVRYVAPAALMTTQGVGKSAGDYIASELVRANLDRVEDQIDIILNEMRPGRRQCGLIFAVSIDHARAFERALRAAGEDPGMIIGDMAATDRAAQVVAYKSGEKRIAVTVTAALTGLDVPRIDLIASCRPTLSPIVHVQSIGRGTRPAPGKHETLVLDFAENVRTFGTVADPHFDRAGQPVGGLAPWAPCRTCATYNRFEAVECSHCRTLLIVRPEPREALQIATREAMKFGSINFTRESRAIRRLVDREGMHGLRVEAFDLCAWAKRDDPDARSVMLSFALGGDAIVRKWVSTAQLKHYRWLNLWLALLGRLPPPNTLQDAFERRHELVRPASIDIAEDGAFWRVAGIDYGADTDETEAA